MKWEIIKNKEYITITHIAVILAVLGSSEPFDRADISPWVMIISLGLLLICYFIFRAIKLKYIPNFDILIAFCDILIWLALLYTADYWSNITGWDSLIYVVYPFITGIFFICLLVMNLVVYIIKWVQAKKMQI